VVVVVVVEVEVARSPAPGQEGLNGIEREDSVADSFESSRSLRRMTICFFNARHCGSLFRFGSSPVRSERRWSSSLARSSL
jgi:hypothetical protein